MKFEFSYAANNVKNTEIVRITEMAKTAPPAMRLNFPYHPEDRICEGVKRLASAVKSVL